jgi:alpha-tubulin suppressor-like RCC1 family protein
MARANGTGQLGDNSTTNSQKPVAVYNLDKSAKLTVGNLHTCVVTAKKAAKCWGYNAYGAIGDNTTTDTPRSP